MNKELQAKFKMFTRNDRWGTCGDCPIDSEGNKYPEFCENTERYDHHLSFDELNEAYRRARKLENDETICNN